jgi:uncharacterized protein YjbK
MASHTETELKWALDQAAYAALAQRLPAELGPARRLAQENRFFDAADGRLRRATMSVRLRREDGSLLLTCKTRLPKQHGAHRHDEWERPLDPAIWSALTASDLRARLPLPEHIVAALGDAPLVALGGFANERLEFRRGDEVLALDRTDFGTRIDHELEIETPDPKGSAAHWSQRLASWGVAWNPQSRTKFARYLDLRGG